MNFDYLHIHRALTFIGSRRFSFLTCGRLKPAGRFFSLAQCLQLALCDWMSHVESLTDGSVQDAVLNYIGAEFWPDYAKALDPQARSAWPLVTIAFATGQRYVLLEGRQQWYDIFEGKLLPELPKRPVTMILCDLTALWAETLDRLEKLGGDHAKLEHRSAEE